VLGLAPPSDETDLYEDAHKHALVCTPNEDLAVIEETRLPKQESTADKTGDLEISDLSDDSDGKRDASDGEDEGEPIISAGGGKKAQTKKKKLTAPEKVCHLLFIFCHTNNLSHRSCML
jgi:hypothetical protein